MGRRTEAEPAMHESGFGKKLKGCDIGYALAANSCERADNMDACTVTALDAITAFAVPNPGVSSQIRRFFRVRSSCGSPRPLDHPAYLGLATIFEANPFSRRRDLS